MAIVAVSMFATGCNRNKTISDEDLRQIYREVYLSNSYVNNIRPMYAAQIDSVDIYSPILNKYGYSYEDFLYTMENFARRKSSKMSDIVTEVLAELESESAVYSHKLSVIDTIDARASRWFSYNVLEVDSIKATRVRDTANLRVYAPVEGDGTMQVKYYYKIDSIDRNKSFKTTIDIVQKDGEKRHGMTHWMSGRAHTSTAYNTNIAVNRSDSLLEILFGNYPKNMTRPSMRIDSLTVKYVPERSIALDSLARRVKPIRLPQILLDEQAKKDSVALHTNPGWIVPQRIDND